MESYRLSSKIIQKDREYMVQTVNDTSCGAVRSTLYADGVPAESIALPHPAGSGAEEVLSFVNLTHNERKQELEVLLKACDQHAEEGDPRMIYHLGTALYYKGLYGEARDLLSIGSILGKDSHSTLNALGHAELAQGNTKAAVAAFAEAVKIRPGFADYRNSYAESLIEAGEYRKAIEELESALEINMYYSDAYFNMGLAELKILMEGGKSSEFSKQVNHVQDLFRRASLTQTELQGSTFDKGMIALDDHELLKGYSFMQKVRSMRRESRRQEFASFHMRFILHPELVTEQALKERIVFLKSQLDKNPTYVDMHTELALCHFEQSRMAWANGLERLKMAIDLNPSLMRLIEKSEQGEEISCLMNDLVRMLSEKE